MTEYTIYARTIDRWECLEEGKIHFAPKSHFQCAQPIRPTFTPPPPSHKSNFGYRLIFHRRRKEAGLDVWAGTVIRSEFPFRQVPASGSAPDPHTHHIKASRTAPGRTPPAALEGIKEAWTSVKRHSSSPPLPLLSLLLFYSQSSPPSLMSLSRRRHETILLSSFPPTSSTRSPSRGFQNDCPR